MEPRELEDLVVDFYRAMYRRRHWIPAAAREADIYHSNVRHMLMHTSEPSRKTQVKMRHYIDTKPPIGAPHGQHTAEEN
jgi:hypothetical protein